MQSGEPHSLWDALRSAGEQSAQSVHGYGSTIRLSDLAAGSSLGTSPEMLRGRTVLLTTRNALSAATALMELDGLARRLLLCPPDLPLQHLPTIVATAGVDVIVSDYVSDELRVASVPDVVTVSPTIAPARVDRAPSERTEWVLFTSGTTGVPKMVVHTLRSLAGAIKPSSDRTDRRTWGTFYDIRRYGGLQIFLRAVLGGSSLLVTSGEEAVPAFLARAAQQGVTHMTGTPSHWRKVLMANVAGTIAPRYARLSGEIADQGILDDLRAAYPTAEIVHAFASTEAGVAFEVHDGLAGFPANYLDQPVDGVDLKIEDGSLLIRSDRTARRWLGDQPQPLLDNRGYVDTGDLLELRDGRYHFAGRRGGIINVGGLKIHPEEIEGVINQHPRVRMSLVKARKNPITGAVVVAEVVLIPDDGNGTTRDTAALQTEILDRCRRALPAHKVPALVRFVPALEIAPSGKIVRRDA